MENLPERIRIKDIARLAEVSVGTVDRVLHDRPGVSQSSRERVEKILNELDYHPNMYASALASNKKYHFIYLLPTHKEGSYWCDIENGIKEAVNAYSDFHISIQAEYYDPYAADSFDRLVRTLPASPPDGVILSPTSTQATAILTKQLDRLEIPFVFVDSNVSELNPLAFFGQHSEQSGYFAGSMLAMLQPEMNEVVVFRYSHGAQSGQMNQQRNRENGFRRYMAEHHPQCKILELDVDVELTPGEVDGCIDRFFANHPNVKCGLTFNSQVGIFGEYMQRKGMTDFELLGYDLLERNVKCLLNKAVRFLIAQQPFSQGYNSIVGLCNHLILKKEVKQLNYMPIDLLTADNVDYYIDARK